MQDVVDSDFDEPEEPVEENDDAAERDVRREERAKRRRLRSGKYVDPALKRRRETNVYTGASKERVRTKGSERQTAASTIEKRGLRKSTKARSEKAAQDRKRKLEEEEERKKERVERERKKVKVRLPTQEELLEEAKETEKKNREDLKNLLRLEEEKKRLPPPKKANTGPKLRFTSQHGRNVISFTDDKIDLKDFLFPTFHPKRSIPKPAFCVVTGAPAKYKDPVTGFPYASADAFRRLRGREDGKQPTNTTMNGNSRIVESGRPEADDGVHYPHTMATKHRAVQWSAWTYVLFSVTYCRLFQLFPAAVNTHFLLLYQCDISL